MWAGWPLLESNGGSDNLCETCREIEKEIELNPEGGEYIETPSFPGKTVQKLDAHFKYHWKEDYELIDQANRRPAK